MNALALITCLYLVIVLPSFMKWLQIRAAKWIHLHLCFTASIQGKASAMSTSTFAVWACFHHSFNFHLSPWKWETVWKLRGSLREVPPFATFCHPVCHRVSAVCGELRQPHLPWVSTGHCSLLGQWPWDFYHQEMQSWSSVKSNTHFSETGGRYKRFSPDTVKLWGQKYPVGLSLPSVGNRPFYKWLCY